MPNATLADQYTLATTPAFQQRVEAAMVSAAVAIMAEAPTQLTPMRQRYARAVLANPSSYAPVLAVGVAVNSQVIIDAGSPPTQTSVTDADINNAVSAIWNDYAAQ